jgi:hypothetical protein
MEMATGEEGAEGPKLGCLLLELELAMVPGWIQDDDGQTYAKEPGRCRQRACFDGDLRDAGREEDGGLKSLVDGVKHRMEHGLVGQSRFRIEDQGLTWARRMESHQVPKTSSVGACGKERGKEQRQQRALYLVRRKKRIISKRNTVGQQAGYTDTHVGISSGYVCLSTVNKGPE